MQYTQLSRRSAGGKIDWEKQYLTFIPVEDAVFSWAERATSGHLEYSLNGGQTWVTIADGESTPTITAGSKVIWRGNLRPVDSTTNTSGIGTFSASGNYHAYGNTMSLLFYDNYYNRSLGVEIFRSAFAALFYNDYHVLTAPLLPSTDLALRIYNQMFRGCTSLTTAPVLPAATLANSCYSQMFRGCTSLISAPELPATSLTYNCYSYMFYGCTNLTAAPDLSATTLIERCCYQMFKSCSRLSYIKCLATNISATSCTSSWLSGVASTGTFVKAAGMEDWTTGASGIPSGWTVVDDNA